ncbi:VIT1/CCC1 transporter family protein, partial [Patescibacteria group bacterium]
VSYFLAGFIPLLPYIFFDISIAFWLAIALAIVALVTLALVNAKVFKIKPFSHALEMAVIGGIAIGVGVAVGKIMGMY